MKRSSILAIIATAALALPAAACGGSPSASGSGTAGGSTRSLSTNSQMLAYAQCVRSHGVPDFPDPDSSGALDKSKMTPQHLGVSDSELQAAENPCQHLLPNGGGRPTPAQLEKEGSDA